MADETVVSPEQTPVILSAKLLRALGYPADEGGALYYYGLAKFLEQATVEERAQADTPAGLVMVLRKRLDAKLAKEAGPTDETGMKIGIGLGILALFGLGIYLANRK